MARFEDPLSKLKRNHKRELPEVPDYEQPPELTLTSKKDLRSTSYHPLKYKKGADPRPNFRVVPCCRNCKFSVGRGPCLSRLGCRWPIEDPREARASLGPNFAVGKMSTTDKAFVRAFPPCNSTTLCDNWKLRPATVNSATKYCGAELVEEKKKGTKGTK